MVVQEQDGARAGDVAVMSGVVLLCVNWRAGWVCLPVFSVTRFKFRRKS